MPRGTGKDRGRGTHFEPAAAALPSTLLLAHLSDLHLRDDDDLALLEGQLDRIVARNAQHLAITGDLFDLSLEECARQLLSLRK